MVSFLRSLQSRLFLLIFIVSLPGVIAVFIQFTEARNKAVEVAKDRAIAIVDNLTAEQSKIIEDTKYFLKRLSKSPVLLMPDSLECSQFLAEQRNLTGHYANLGAPNANGDLLCNAFPLNKPVNVADRAYIKKAIASRDFSIGKFQFDRAAEKVSVNFAYPVINTVNDKIVALIVAVVSLNWWSERLENTHLPSHSVAYIIDSEQKIIAVYPENKKQLGLPISHVQSTASSLYSEGSKILEDSNKSLRIFVSRKLIKSNIENPVNIVVGIPFEDELSAINTRLIKTFIIFLLFTLSIVLFAIWAIKESVLTPIKRLKNSTKKLAIGIEVNDHLLSGTRELVDLQSQFFSMAKTRLHAEQQLKNSQALLQVSEDKLSRHLNQTPLASISWDKNFICTEWNKAAEKIFGYSEVEVLGFNISDLLVTPEEKSKFIENYDLLRKGTGGTHGQHVHITKTNSVITCNWYNTLLLDNESKLTAVGALVQDITVDKRNRDILDSFFELPINLHLIMGFDGTISKVNKGCETTLGYNSEQLIKQPFLVFIHPGDIDETKAQLDKLKNGEMVFYFENWFRAANGKYSLIAWTASASVEEKAIYAVGTDITKRRLAEDKLKLAAGVFTHAKEAIMITDAENNIIDVNATFTLFTGYLKEEVIGKKPNILKSTKNASALFDEMWKSILKEGTWSGEIWNKRKNGEVYPQLLTISTIYKKNGKVQNYIALFTDISTLKAHQQQLEHIAHYDVLTSLPNRTLLADRLMQLMPLCKRHEKSLAVAFLDLDGFKAINDLHGHNRGDQVLIKIASRMKEALREEDTLSRFGGDEFVAILTDLDTPQACETVLDRLLKALSTPIIIDGIVIKVSTSIGVTIYPHDDVDAEQLLRHADQAMYIAKQEGKNRFNFFDMAQDIALKNQHDNLKSVADALKNNEFVLYYQPKVNMRTGEIIGAEALIRWQHPQRGLLAPAEFLPIIEHHELIIQVGEWVIENALHQMTVWKKQHLDLIVSVNIDALQLQQACFVKRLAELLAIYPEINANALELEVLETSALADVEEVSKIMHACIKLGVSFSLDDFGTGYCSLTYLKKLPVKIIKIDRSFIRDMLDDSDDLAIVKGVMGLSEAFQREVIAEGVETLQHGNALLSLGCYLAQGYGIAKPMPAEDFVDWANNWKPDKSWTR